MQLHDSVAECGGSGQKIVLAGYSQGAWAVHAAVQYLGTVNSPLLDHIAGVALRADPLRSTAIAFPNKPRLGPRQQWGLGNIPRVGLPELLGVDQRHGLEGLPLCTNRLYERFQLSLDSLFENHPILFAWRCRL
jgi:hypothetical protein